MKRIIPPWRDIRPNGFYIYAHFNKSSGNLFYIGKGKCKRGWAIESGRNSRWAELRGDCDVSIRIIASGLSESKAYDAEIRLVSYARNKGINLANISNGGGGNSGICVARRVTVFTSLGETFLGIDHAANFLRGNGYPTAVGSNISSCSKGRGYFVYGRIWSLTCFPEHPKNNDLVGHMIKQNRKKHNRIYTSAGDVFLSMHDAIESLKSNGYPLAAQGTISRAISNGGTSYDRMWSYSEFSETSKITSKESWLQKVSFSVSDSSGNVFPSLKAAEIYLRENGYPLASYTGISKCISGKQKSAYGTQWKRSGG